MNYADKAFDKAKYYKYERTTNRGENKSRKDRIVRERYTMHELGLNSKQMSVILQWAKKRNGAGHCAKSATLTTMHTRNALGSCYEYVLQNLFRRFQEE